MERSLRELLPRGRFAEVDDAVSAKMASIRSKGNKSTERKLRSALARAGIKGWILCATKMKGKPDFFFPDVALAVFVDGCFWHGCPSCGHVPAKNADYWRAKFRRNRERDQSTTAELRRQGTSVLRFWEHELRADVDGCVHLIEDRLRKRTKDHVADEH